MGPYVEEDVALITWHVKDEVAALQAAGEPHPVVLIVSPHWPPGPEPFGLRPSADDYDGCLVVLPRAEAAGRLNAAAGPGVGDKMLGFPPAAPEAFYMAAPTPGAVESHLLIVPEGALLRVGGARPDLATGRVQILMQEL
jgi:hypothetical protein